MVEILKSFEQAAAWFRPIVLLLPGLLATALGLFVWLGGLGFRRVLLAVLGAVVGALGAFASLGPNPAVMVLTGLVGGRHRRGVSEILCFGAAERSGWFRDLFDRGVALPGGFARDLGRSVRSGFGRADAYHAGESQRDSRPHARCDR